MLRDMIIFFLIHILSFAFYFEYFILYALHDIIHRSAHLQSTFLSTLYLTMEVLKYRPTKSTLAFQVRYLDITFKK